MSGNTVLAKALASQKLEYCFGIVGVPVLELGAAIQSEGIKYYGFRNEQAASYSAQAVGYLTGRPGICLCVSGPGMVHGVAGLANAWSNNWPMILIAGASDINQDGKGGFQESNQLSLAQPYCKFAYRITDVRQIPFMVEKAVKISIAGRPGPVYLELPGDVLGILYLVIIFSLASQIQDESQIYYPALYKDIPVSQSTNENIIQALELLKKAKKPLLIIGKGAQYAQSEKELNYFVNQTNIPFLPTPLGKGLVSDNHPQCVGPARSTALGQADVILLAGARLNWILHFGKPPRFQKDVKIIQIDISPEELDTNVRGSINLLGDIKQIFKQFNYQMEQGPRLRLQSNDTWWQILQKKCQKNKDVSLQLMTQTKTPMSHYQALHIINQKLPKDFFYVAEGGNTMDIGRTVISQTHPRTKLDAGTYGTMGIGMPYAIAAQAVNPQKPIVCIFGDSAFGFSAMEVETAVRYNMPLIIFVLNNNGIFFGHDEMPENNNESNLAPTSLKIETRYEKMADAFGGEGIFVKNLVELENACNKVFSGDKKLYIVNVMIDPYGVRKPQEHSWLTKEEPKPKL